MAFIFFLKGLVAISAQSLLLRELFVVAHGNEFSFGLVLGIWLIFGGIGSITGGRIKKPRLVLYHFLLLSENLWLVLALFAIRAYAILFHLQPGQMMGIMQFALLSALGAGIFNFVQGLRFVAGGTLFRAGMAESEAVGFLYGWEGAGALAGGFLFAFVLQKFFNPFALVGILSALNWLAGIYALRGKIRLATVILCVIVGLSWIFSLIFSERADLASSVRQWAGKPELIAHRNTPYGNITVLERENERSFMIDGVLLLTVPHPDIEWIEETVNFPFLASLNQEIKDALVIGADAKGVIPEILKHRVLAVDCFEINTDLIELLDKYAGRHYLGLDDPRVRLTFDDPISALRKTRKTWDIIFLDAGFPSSLKTARYYTAEFYKQISAHLSQNGIFCFVIEGSQDYIGGSLVKVHATILKTLKTAFPAIGIIPGYSTIYIAGNNKDAFNLVPERVARRLTESRLKTFTFTPDLIQDRLSRTRIELFQKTVEREPSAINTISKPLIVFFGINHWLALSGIQTFAGAQSKEYSNIARAAGLLCVLVVFLSLVGIRKKKIVLPFTVGASGFACAVWELIILFLFQIRYGSVYFWLSILTGLLMAGISAGSMIFAYKGKYIQNLKNQIFLWELLQLSFGILVIFFITATGKSGLPPVFFFLLAVAAGGLLGWEFPLVNAMCHEKKMEFVSALGGLYAMDLLGASIGCLIAGVILIPLLGIITPCLLIVALKAANSILVWRL